MPTTKTPLQYLSATAAAVMMLSATAMAQEACAPYTVQDGDSLASIANSAYGSFDYQMIFNANRNVISDPNNLAPGTLLQIPCEDGNLSADSRFSDVITREEQKEADRIKGDMYQPSIKMVTGSGWAPYTGEDLKGGGIFVRLATTALHRGGNARGHSLSFVDDWPSHLRSLLPLGAFDVSIAWIKPGDCSDLDTLDSEARMRCTQLDFSLPVYETVTGYWSTSDNPYANVTSFADYAGARICRPNGWSISDLTSEGLVEPVVTMVRPATTRECVEALLKGDADMASINLESGTAIVAEIPEAKDRVQPNPSLSKLETIHFVTHKTNPRGRVYISLLNKGLLEMRESGEWYAIIADSLSEFNKIDS